jgi:uncharacterized peroxidase-related enzyme
MAWIKEIKREEDSRLEKIYSEAEKRTNEPTANILRVHSVCPDILEIHMKLYERLMFGESKLSRVEREAIGVVVSKSNECTYCVSHHQTALNFVSNHDDQMKKIAINFREADLSDRLLSICEYAEKLTKTPYKMTEKDVVGLRKFELDDHTIFEINQIVAYFNYVNRIAFGLGVELENR